MVLLSCFLAFSHFKLASLFLSPPLSPCPFLLPFCDTESTTHPAKDARSLDVEVSNGLRDSLRRERVGATGDPSSGMAAGARLPARSEWPRQDTHMPQAATLEPRRDSGQSKSELLF